MIIGLLVAFSGRQADSSHDFSLPQPAVMAPVPAAIPSGVAAGQGVLPRASSPHQTSDPREVKDKQEVSHPAASALPAWVTVPSVGIGESLVPVGLNKRGQLVPPPGQTVWYSGSVRPGEVGNSVVAGHVEYGHPDVFWNLDHVQVGAPVSIRYSDGAMIQLRVVRTESVDKTALQNDPRVWVASNKPVVVLITCDRHSPTDETGHHYTRNFVVWAQS